MRHIAHSIVGLAPPSLTLAATNARWKQEETSETLRSGRADVARTVGVQTEDGLVREGNAESSEGLVM